MVGLEQSETLVKSVARSRRSQSASQNFRKQLHGSRQTAKEGLLEDLEAVTQELAEVKEVLRHGGTFLGMSGTLLQEYFIELAKKDNLLRLALTRVSSSCAKGRSPTDPAFNQLTKVTKRRSHTLPARRDAKVVELKVEGERQASPNTLDPAACTSCPELALADNGSCSTHHVFESTLTESSQSLQLRSSPWRHDEIRATSSTCSLSMEASSHKMDSSKLSAVLDFLTAHPLDAKAQHAGIHAVGQLARDAVQLRPLCVAAAGAVAHCINSFQSNVRLNRLSLTAIGNIAYMPEVSALIANEALPALFSSMIAHGSDKRIQVLACEALARLAQAGEIVVVKAIVQTMLTHVDAGAIPVCCRALARLCDQGICKPVYVLDVLSPLSESQPSQLTLQQRASCALQLLVRYGAVDEAIAKKRAPALLAAQWTHLLTRFVGADEEEARQAAIFHADIQSVFHEEVVKHFEYEAAERCLHLMQRRASGKVRLLEVVRCLVENVEDYQSRLDAREFAWDPIDKQLVPLDKSRREELCGQALQNMEAGLFEALQVAASTENQQVEEDFLLNRATTLRNECAALLDRKTEATQLHQERTMELRREVMLFEAVEYLELRANIDVSATQIRSALHMLSMVEPIAPPEVVDRLRLRLDRLASSRRDLSMAVPAG